MKDAYRKAAAAIVEHERLYREVQQELRNDKKKLSREELKKKYGW